VKIDPQSFANEWLAAWNSHDLVRILGHFTDDIVFRSPHAVELAGEPSGEVRGKDALRAYWSTGLSRRPDLRFTLDGVRASIDAIVILYRDELGRSCAEVLEFRADKVCRGFGAYERQSAG
jgi:hypothetical protein